jgi:hypothetical protein
MQTDHPPMLIAAVAQHPKRKSKISSNFLVVKKDNTASAKRTVLPET